MNVAIIFGGVSSEHDVSCLTAGGVARAIDSQRFNVIGIGITPSGRWIQYSLAELASLEVTDGQLPRLCDDRPAACFVPGPAVATIMDDHLIDKHPVDLVFSLLHGPFGEDGTIQGLCEIWGLPYVGAGVAASAIGMDKALMKAALAAAELPIGPYVAFSAAEYLADPGAWTDAVTELGFPVYVKPARGGSSIGITRVSEPESLGPAVAEAARWDPKIVVEQGIEGAREIELAVLGSHDGAPRVSLPGEIIVHSDDGFYDFTAKYLPEEQVTLQVPADVPNVAELQDLAARTFTAIGAEGLGRVDLFVRGTQVLVNEINTMPGFTRHSMFPSMWAASGLAYGDLISELIGLAANRPVGLR